MELPAQRSKNAELEARVLSVVDRLRARQPIEDRRVEVKRDWIDEVKAARRIAGHACEFAIAYRNSDA